MKGNFKGMRDDVDRMRCDIHAMDSRIADKVQVEVSRPLASRASPSFTASSTTTHSGGRRLAAGLRVSSECEGGRRQAPESKITKSRPPS